MKSLIGKIVTRINRMQIRQKMMFIVISTSIVTLLILSLITLFSTFGIREIAIRNGQEIGQQASDDSSEILREQKEYELLATAKDRVNIINYMMNELGRDTEQIAKAATTMLQRPNEYTVEPLFYPDQIKLKGKVTYLQYADPATKVNREEIEKLSSIQKMMVQTIEYNPMITDISVASKTGFKISAHDFDQIDNGFDMSGMIPRYFNHFQIDWYQNALQAGKLVFSDARNNAFEPLKNVVFHYSAPYYDARGEIAGVVELEEDINTVNKVVNEADIPEAGFYFVVDKNGHVLLHNSSNSTADDELAVPMKDLRESANEELAELAKSMTAGETGVKQITINGIKHYVAYAPVTEVNWSCAEAINVDKVLEPVNKNYKIINDIVKENDGEMSGHIINTILMMVFIIFILLLVVIYIGRMLSDYFVKPIRQLTEGMREIATGNFDQRIDIRTGDEIEALADSVNAMTTDLKSYIKHLQMTTAENERLSAHMKEAERSRFVNELLKYSMSGENPDKILKHMLKHLGKELAAERTYIFEELNGHIFANTYEWCAEGVTAEMAHLQDLPYEGVVDVWYNEYQKSGKVIIYDLEEYHAVSEGMYNVLKPQGIKSLVTAPLELDGKYIGFFGVDNPPMDKIPTIAETLQLIAYFIATVVRQKQYLAHERERIEKELDAARKIQAGMLPNIFPPFPERTEIDLYASMTPAREVGGDFYDFYLLNDNRLAVTIADVSDKGVPAALFMAASKTIIKNFTVTMQPPDDLASVLRCANDQLCCGNDNAMFVTVFLGLLDLKTGKFIYASAGHNPPLFCRATGEASYLYFEPGTPLGMIENMQYNQYEISLTSNDILFLYTDGVTEAMNEEDELYGMERLSETLQRAGGAHISMQKILAAIRADVDVHANGVEQYDDITMLGVRFLGQ